MSTARHAAEPRWPGCFPPHPPLPPDPRILLSTFSPWTVDPTEKRRNQLKPLD